MQRNARRWSAPFWSALVAGLCATVASHARTDQPEVPDDPLSLYNAACDRSRFADLAEAEQLLLRALKAGFSDLSWMQRDPDLIPIREGPVFRTIMRARDAADPILASRQRDEWLDVLGIDEYRVRIDPERHLSYVTALDDAALAPIVVDMAWRSEYLVDTLFDEPLRHFVLVAMPQPEDRSRLLPDTHVHGSYHHSRRRLVAADGQRALRHELVHVLHHSDMDRRGQAHPMWIQEGLACVYESLVLDEDGFVLIRPTERESIVRSCAANDELPDWPSFFAMGDRSLLSEPGRNYAMARSIFLFLAERELIGAWYDAYTSRFDFDPTGALAMEAVFRLPLAAVEAEWRSWVDSGRGTRLVVDRTAGVTQVPEIPAGFGGVGPLGVPGAGAEEEKEEELSISLLLSDGKALYDAGDYEKAIRVFHEVIEIVPDHPAARYALGLAYLRTSDIEAAREQKLILDGLDRSLGSLLSNLTTK